MLYPQKRNNRNNDIKEMIEIMIAWALNMEALRLVLL